MFDTGLSMGACVHNAHAFVKSKCTYHPVHFARMQFDDRPDYAIRLEEARRAKGFASARSAAEYFGWKYDTYAQHENGQRGITRAADRYAKAYGVSAGWLLKGEGDAALTNVPLLSWVSAGRMERAAGVTSAEIERYVPVADLPRGDWFALSVHGDSMNRIAPEGSIIVVNRADDTLINDRFYIFASDQGEATFKQWRREPSPMLRPYSTNLDHLAIPAEIDQYYVVGRVRRVITDV